MADKDLLLFKSYFESDCGFESDEMMDYDELDCSDPLAMSSRCPLHEGLRIEISENPHSVRQVANVVIALQRMKKFTRRVQSTEFTDHELLNIILETVVEESVVRTTKSDFSKTYTKQGRDIQCTVCDSLKKSLVQFPGAPFLLAVTLKGGNSSRSVSINLSSYTTSRYATKGQPVCLGIAQSDLYLTCTNVSGTPNLSLEVVKDKETLKTIYENDDMARFLFLRKVTGDSSNTFESVKYPGWFISTAKTESKPVEMCAEKDVTRQKVFSLLNQKVI